MEETEDFKKEVIRSGFAMSERERRIALWFWQLVEEARKEAVEWRGKAKTTGCKLLLPWERLELEDVITVEEKPQTKPQPLPNPCKYKPK